MDSEHSARVIWNIDPRQRRQRLLDASSTTSWTSPRSKPASWMLEPEDRHRLAQHRWTMTWRSLLAIQAPWLKRLELIYFSVDPASCRSGWSAIRCRLRQVLINLVQQCHQVHRATAEVLHTLIHAVASHRRTLHHHTLPKCGTPASESAPANRAASAVPTVPTDRRLHHAPFRRHRPGIVDRAPPGRTHGRRSRGREHRGRGLVILVTARFGTSSRRPEARAATMRRSSRADAY